MNFLKPVRISAVSVLLLFFIQCKKDDVKEKPNNVVLTGKSLNEVRAIIKGDWFVVRGTVCGIIGCQTTYHDVGAADVMSFLAEDTLKQTGHAGTPVYKYEKADSVKFKSSYSTGLPAWTFYFSTPLAFTKIENDTLIAEMGYGEIGLLQKR